MVQWDLEREIWAKAFKSASLSSKGAGNNSGGWDPSSTGLLLTEPIFNFPAVQAATEEVRRGRGGAPPPLLCGLPPAGSPLCAGGGGGSGFAGLLTGRPWSLPATR